MLFLVSHQYGKSVSPNGRPIIHNRIKPLPVPNLSWEDKSSIEKKRYTLLSESSIISWYLSTNIARIHPVGMALPTNSNKVQNTNHASTIIPQYLLPWVGYLVVKIFFFIHLVHEGFHSIPLLQVVHPVFAALGRLHGRQDFFLYSFRPWRISFYSIPPSICCPG